MCGRYVLKKEDLEKMLQKCGITPSEHFQSRYNIAPTSIVPVLRSRTPAAIEAIGMRWGLIPAWTKPDGPVKPLVNLRAETLVSRFQGALRSHRCVLPASGFFEWETVGARKQAWFFSAPDQAPFGLAGIWATWRGGDGLELETCTILTTTPNDTLRPIHDRMPVLLSPEQCREWLDQTIAPTELQRLLTAAPASALTSARVGAAVNSVKNDGPECIAPAPEPPPASDEPQLSLGL